ncbi:MAG: DegT/DnrJ/EryC1/StrS family aminotransferase [Ruminococcus sp.]
MQQNHWEPLIKGVQTGTFGEYNAISFNGNKIITGSSGGMLLTDSMMKMLQEGKKVVYTGQRKCSLVSA